RFPVEISLEAPDSGNFRGLTTTSGWALVLRFDAPRALAIVETPEEPTVPVGRREAVVLTDPDGCLDMRHFPITRAGIPFEDCAGPDEEFFEFTTERIDSFDLLDGQTGNFQVREQLVDDAFATGVLLDKPYLLSSAGQVEPVPRPQTGGELLDGYGFGPDDDLAGLVVMANLGAARVFDERFDRKLGPVIRNMAGFVNTVAQELRTKRGGPALTAYMHVQGGMFEPLAVFDLDVEAAGTDFLRRVDSGRVRRFRFVGTPQSDDDILRELLSTYGPYELELRAALVEGVAPTFIRDMNEDGRYTVADLRRMGHQVISNEARLRLVVDFDALVTDTSFGRTCPPPSLLYRDLDGNGRDGAISCSGSGGAARVRRVPQ
ncbi:MAG TPA: hypothetical protein VFU77_02660, partial [Steroidobacteraceae bacterium]|nr:hypothetical protein [Steroidobacteraceae bacterium]